MIARGCERGREAGADDQRAREEPQCERRPEVRERLRDQHPRVDESRDHRGCDPQAIAAGRGTKRRASAYAGKIDAVMTAALMYFARCVGAPGCAEPPCRCDQVLVERAEGDVVQPQLGHAVMRDAARTAGPFELVGEEPRSRMLARLPRIEDRARRHTRRTQRVAASSPVEDRPLSLGGCLCHFGSVARLTCGSTIELASNESAVGLVPGTCLARSSSAGRAVGVRDRDEHDVGREPFERPLDPGGRGNDLDAVQPAAAETR